MQRNMRLELVGYTRKRHNLAYVATIYALYKLTVTSWHSLILHEEYRKLTNFKIELLPFKLTCTNLPVVSAMSLSLLTVDCISYKQIYK